MSTLTDDNIAILRRMHQHGPMTAEQFREEFPKINRPTVRLASLCHHGWIRADREDTRRYAVTLRGEMALRDDDTTETSVAEPRRTVTTGHYTGQRETPMRSGAEDFLKCPSLIGGERVMPRGTRS